MFVSMDVTLYVVCLCCVCMFVCISMLEELFLYLHLPLILHLAHGVQLKKMG